LIEHAGRTGVRLANEAHTPYPTAFEGVMGMNMSASAQKGSDDPILQWVTFKLDNETYGINVMRVQEVLRYTEIAPVPGAPSYVLGIINLRGNVVTVIDTRQRFGLDTAEVTDNTRIVIIEADKQVVGILVDSVAEVVYLRQSEVETAPNVGNEESAKFIQGVCNKNNELLILVEQDKKMSEEEWSELESI
jgi:purine-binding chemotaxis protein CheW